MCPPLRSIRARFVAVNAAPPRGAVEISEKKAAEGHHVGQKQPANEGIEEQLDESRQAEQQRRNELQQKISAYHQHQIRNQPLDPVLDDKVIARADELEAAGAGLINQFRHRVEQDVESELDQPNNQHAVGLTRQRRIQNPERYPQNERDRDQLPDVNGKAAQKIVKIGLAALDHVFDQIES